MVYVKNIIGLLHIRAKEMRTLKMHGAKADPAKMEKLLKSLMFALLKYESEKTPEEDEPIEEEQCCANCANILYDYHGKMVFNKEAGCMDCWATANGRTHWKPRVPLEFEEEE